MPDLEAVIGDWMRHAAPILMRDITVQAKLPGMSTRQKVRWQPDGAEIDCTTVLGHGVNTEIHIEWFITAGQEFDCSTTVTFQGGAPVTRRYRFPWSKDVGEQGVEIGQWIHSLEPAP